MKPMTSRLRVSQVGDLTDTELIGTNIDHVAEEALFWRVCAHFTDLSDPHLSREAKKFHE